MSEADRLRMHPRHHLVALLTVVALSGSAGVCWGAVRIQVLVIGNNRPLVDGDGRSSDPPVATLRYADDDAAAFYELLGEIADAGHLLTVMDGDTQAKYPKLAEIARPPTVTQVREAVAAIGRRIDENRVRGDLNVVFIFFSGHGSVPGASGPALALLDGGIDHRFLYDEILSKIPADYVHLFVDACHAEAVVRPRDTQAASVPVTPAEADAFLIHSTLARFPHVGAIVAASSDAQAHEWDQLGHGVFTHELLSALRGAADVNRDGRIEYSEIYAFLAAANRAVGDPRARLSVVARPPEIDRRVAILDLSLFPATRMTRLRGVPSGAGLVEVEDDAGHRLASLHGEPGFVADLIVPAGVTYVRAGDKEARFEGRAGENLSFGGLRFRDQTARPRGAVGDALRRGLFASEFGPAYYTGFIDQAPDFASVAFEAADVVRAQAPSPTAAEGSGGETFARRIALGVGASGTVARAFDISEAARLGLRPERLRGWTLSLEFGRAAQPMISESRATVLAGWVWSVGLGPARAYTGAAVGGGVIQQTAFGEPVRWSGQVAAGPSLGVAADVGRRIGVWAEGQALGLAYRRDGHTSFMLTPSAFLGASLGF